KLLVERQDAVDAAFDQQGGELPLPTKGLLDLSTPVERTGLAHGAAHRRNQAGEPLLEHVVRGAASYRLDGRLLAERSGEEDQGKVLRALASQLQGCQAVEGWQR